MFARLALYEIPGDRADEAVRRFRGAAKEIRQMAGLKDVYVLVNAEAERAVTMAIWETRDLMERSRVTASRLRSEAAREVEGNVISVEEFELVDLES